MSIAPSHANGDVCLCCSIQLPVGLRLRWTINWDSCAALPGQPEGHLAHCLINQIHLKVQSKTLSKTIMLKATEAKVCPQGGTKGNHQGTYLTSDACCVQGGPSHSDGLCAHMTLSAPVFDLYSNDFSSCIFQNCLSALVTGFGNERSSDYETCVASE